MARKRNTTFIIDTVPIFNVGDPAPEGYLEWHEWARIQHKGGLRQRYCQTCQLYKFPQEKCGHD